MAISKESKDAIRARMEQLDGLRVPLVKELQELNEKRAGIVARRDEIDAAIAKLKADLNG
jgi:uncharacterized coiled-coil DUF342 family protein